MSYVMADARDDEGRGDKKDKCQYMRWEVSAGSETRGREWECKGGKVKERCGVHAIQRYDEKSMKGMML